MPLPSSNRLCNLPSVPEGSQNQRPRQKRSLRASQRPRLPVSLQSLNQCQRSLQTPSCCSSKRAANENSMPHLRLVSGQYTNRRRRKLQPNTMQISEFPKNQGWQSLQTQTGSHCAQDQGCQGKKNIN